MVTIAGWEEEARVVVLLLPSSQEARHTGSAQQSILCRDLGTGVEELSKLLGTWRSHKGGKTSRDGPGDRT